MKTNQTKLYTKDIVKTYGTSSSRNLFTESGGYVTSVKFAYFVGGRHRAFYDTFTEMHDEEKIGPVTILAHHIVDLGSEYVEGESSTILWHKIH